jgi:hypothetical protein
LAIASDTHIHSDHAIHLLTGKSVSWHGRNNLDGLDGFETNTRNSQQSLLDGLIAAEQPIDELLYVVSGQRDGI